MYIKPEQIYDATNGGLDVILELFPDAAKCVSNPRAKFKIRDEKTGSASLKKLKDGVWIVTDFGGDSKPRNCIELVRLEKNFREFSEAITYLAERYKIVPLTSQQRVLKADFKARAAKPDEKEGEFYYDIKKNFTEFELKVLFAENVISHYQFRFKEKWMTELEKICAELNFTSMNSYTHIKDRKAYILSSSENYPIFLIEGEGFKKVYQPLFAKERDEDENYKFRYIGSRPKDFVMGKQRLIKKYNDLLARHETDDVVEKPKKGKKKSKSDQDLRLPNVAICSGERDSLNALACGLNPIWQNSETATLSGKVMIELRKMCKEILNIPDIDETGQKHGHKLAMRFLDIKTVCLPSDLAKNKDSRGKPCKDLRDFLRFYTVRDFDNLCKASISYQFWDEGLNYTKDGLESGIDYKPNSNRLFNFLSKNGFLIYEDENEKEQFFYIQIIGNIVYKTDPRKIKKFIVDFLKEAFLKNEHGSVQINEKLINTFINSTRLSETSLSSLPIADLDFTDHSKQDQWIFFTNKTLQVTAAGIKEFKPENVRKRIWSKDVIKHDFSLQSAPFTISQTKTAEGAVEFDIAINNSECLFLKYLTNVSRVHWRKEYETSWAEDQEVERIEYIKANQFNIAGPRLTADEIKEQKRHLINKLFTLGYLLHRYKDMSKTWCVLALDARPNEDGESHGGTGKSIAFKSVRYLMQSVTLDGRNPKLTTNPHVYERVTENTDYILVDDANQYFDFDFFFATITGELPVNPKNNKSFSIPFEKAPKFAITTNYALRKNDDSTVRRLLNTVFSDYYHENKDNYYRETKNPKTEFGKNLFQDFTPDEWNMFYNTMAYACSFYLNVEKVDPPMNAVETRNLMHAMGTNFHNWACVYFSEESGLLNEKISREVAYENFKQATGQKHHTSQKFKTCLEAFCKLYHYELNPTELRNKSGRIISKIKVLDKNGLDTGRETTAEMIYIRTTPTEIPKVVQVEPAIKATSPSTDIIVNPDKPELPF